jgi:hypothetical protein
MLFALPIVALSQNAALHWYSLKSIVNINEAQGKEALAVIRNFTSASISDFTDKSNIFKLATTTAVDLDALTYLLNEEGFYIADITHPNGPPYTYHRSTPAFQQALLFCKDHTAFEQLNVTTLALKNAELNLLNAEERQMILSSPIFTIKED